MTTSTFQRAGPGAGEKKGGEGREVRRNIQSRLILLKPEMTAGPMSH